MNASPLKDLSRCAVHTATNKPWTLAQCIEGYAKLGIRAISVWRDVLEKPGAREAGRMLRDAGMAVPALVRGGFFVSKSPETRDKAHADNLRCVDEAEAIGADMIVLVVGAEPGVPLPDARRQVADGIARLTDRCRQAKVKLAIEPLHPMYAGDRSCVNRMKEAREICAALEGEKPSPARTVGIACDVYHVWWDPDLQHEIQLAGHMGTLFGYHVCDWRLPTRHLLTDRGLMGQGCIPLRQIRTWVEAAGFKGYNEVEIFSEEFWAQDQTEYVSRIARAYLEHV